MQTEFIYVQYGLRILGLLLCLYLYFKTQKLPQQKPYLRAWSWFFLLTFFSFGCCVLQLNIPFTKSPLPIVIAMSQNIFSGTSCYLLVIISANAEVMNRKKRELILITSLLFYTLFLTGSVLFLPYKYNLLLVLPQVVLILVMNFPSILRQWTYKWPLTIAMLLLCIQLFLLNAETDSIAQEFLSESIPLIVPFLLYKALELKHYTLTLFKTS